MTDRASNNAFEVLREQLRRQMNELSDHISGGACKDFAEYRHCCGIIEGLAIAERELLDLQERIEKA
mgnify:FL=1